MAIKVNGTTVINDSRSLTNIASIDATTVAAFSAAGVGDITGVTAGSGISGGGTSGTVTISHADTSAQGSVNNSGTTFIQDITLDTYGHITSIGSATVSTTPPTTFNAVGTYAFCMHTSTSVSPVQGSTYSGSTLYPAGLHLWSTFGVDGQNGGTETFMTYGGSTLSGTWRAMGRQGAYQSRWSTTLFVRIS